MLKAKNILKSFRHIRKTKNDEAFKWDIHISNSRSLWERARIEASGTRVLIATSMGCYDHAVLTESLLGVALTLRGAKVDFLLCDEVLPCCQMTKITNVDENLIIDEFQIGNNYPNPFNPNTRIEFKIPEKGYVQANIFDLLGRKVSTLLNKNMQRGIHVLNWNGTNSEGNILPSGIYLLRVEYNNKSLIRKMTFIK